MFCFYFFPLKSDKREEFFFSLSHNFRFDDASH